MQHAISAPYGLEVSYKDLRKGAGLSLVMTDLRLGDLDAGGSEVLRADSLSVSINPLELLRDIHHPENAIGEILLERPRFTLSNELLNRLSQRVSTENSHLHVLVRLERGSLIWPGNPLNGTTDRLDITDARVDLRGYPQLRAGGDFLTGLDPNLKIKASLDYDLQAGQGTADLVWQGATPSIWQQAGWLPSSIFDRIRIKTGRIDGEASIDLAPAPRLAWIRGSLSDGLVDIPGTGLQDIAVKGEADFRGGLLKLTDLRVSGGRSTLEGNVNLSFDGNDPKLGGSITVKGFELEDLASFLSLPEDEIISGHVSGSLALSGTLSQPALRGALDLADGAMTYPHLPKISDVSAKAKLDGQAVALESIQAETLGGRIEGQGEIRLEGGPRLEAKLTADDISAGELSRLLGQGDWSGVLGGGGNLNWARNGWKLDTTLAWNDAAYGGRGLPEGKADIVCSGDGGRLEIEASGNLNPGGGFDIHGEKTGGQWNIGGSLDRMALAPLAAFAPPGLEGVGGEASCDFSWRAGAEPVLEVRNGRFRHLSLNGREIEEFDGDLDWHGTVIGVASGTVKLGSGKAAVSGSYDWSRGNVAAEVSLEKLPLSLWASGAEGSVSGRFTLDGSWPGRLEGAGSARIDDLVYRGESLGDARAELQLDGDELTLSSCSLASAEGSADAHGTISLTGAGKIEMEVDRLDWALGPMDRFLPGRAGLEGRLTGTGQVEGTLDKPSFSARIALGAGEAYGVKWRAITADLRWEDLLTVENGAIDLGGQSFDIAGNVGAAGWNMRVSSTRAELTSLDGALPPILPWDEGAINGLAAVDFTIRGPLRDPALEGEYTISSLRLDRFSCSELSGRFKLADSVLSLPQVSARSGDRSYIASGEYNLADRTVSADLDVEHGDLEGMLELAQLKLPVRAQGDVTGKLKISGDPSNPSLSGTVRLDRGELGGRGIEGELEFKYGGGVMVCDRCSLNYDGGTLSAEGRLSKSASDLRLDGSNFPLDDLAALIGKQPGLSGRADLALTFDRQAGKASGGFDLEIKEGSLGPIKLDHVQATGSIAGRQILITQGEVVSDGNRLDASGQFPLPANLGPLDMLYNGIESGRERIDLQLKGTGVPLAFFNSFIPKEVAISGGTMDLDAGIGGTWKRPTVQGTAVVKGGNGSADFLPEPFKNLSARLKFDGPRVEIEDASVRMGDGALGAKGSVAFAAGGLKYDLELKGNDLSYNSSFFNGRASRLDLRVTGGPLPLIAGGITVEDATIGTAAADKSPSLPPIALDLDLTAGRNVRVFVPAMVDCFVSGEVSLQGHLDDPKLSGVVQASRGSISIYGDRFTLSSASATFSPEQGILPYVDVEGYTITQGIKVYLSVLGEVSQTGLAINLWSDPPLAQQQIVGLLNWSDPEGLGGSVPGPVKLFAGGLKMMLDTVFGQMSENIRRLLDADRLEVTLDGDEGLNLELGKYLQDELYVSYEIGTGNPRGTWTIDYYLQPHLVLNGVFDPRGGSNWNLTYVINF